MADEALTASQLVQQYQQQNGGAPPPYVSTGAVSAPSDAGLTASQLAQKYSADNGVQPPSYAVTAPTASAVPQQTGPMRYVNELGSDLASGTSAILGAPGSAVSAAKALLKGKLGLTDEQANLAVNSTILGLVKDAPSADTLTQGANAAGNKLGIGPVIDRPDLAPQNAVERYGNVAVKALPAAAATILSGGAAAPALLSSIGGNIASEGAKDLGFGWKGQMAASLLAGGAGGAAGVAASAPNVERVAATLGTSTTMQQAGEHLQNAARNWLGVVKPAQETAVWKPVNDLLGPAPTELSATRKVLQDITGNGKNSDVADAMKVLRPNLPDQLKSIFSPTQTIKYGAGNKQTLTRQLPPGPAPSWADVKELRSDIGSAMGRPEMVKQLGEENAQRIYGALTEDMRSVADAHGYAELFDNANAVSNKLNQIARGPMSKIVADSAPHEGDPAPGEAANAVLRGAQHDGTTLQTLRQTIPDAVDELAAAHLRMQSPKYAKLNPQGSAPAALSPEAHAALIPDPATRALIQQVVPAPGKAQVSIPDTLQALGSSAAGAILEHYLVNGGSGSGLGAAALGLAAPKALHILKNVGALPGIIPGAAQGALASPSAILGLTQTPDTSTAR